MTRPLLLCLLLLAGCADGAAIDVPSDSPACSEDPFEDNDARNTAWDFETADTIATDPVLCAGESDWYRFAPGADELATVVVGFDGTPDASIRVFDGAGDLLEEPTDAGGVFLVQVTGVDCGGSGVVFVQVESGGAEEQPYVLDIDLLDYCAD